MLDLRGCDNVVGDVISFSLVMEKGYWIGAAFLCAKIGGGHCACFVVGGVDVPVLPKPFLFLLLAGRYDRRRIAGVAASSKII